MVEFAGTYAHDRDDNFEEVLVKVGVGFLFRKIASRAKPTMKVEVKDDTWTITTVLPIKTLVWSFRLNEEVELEGPEGKMKATFTLDGNVLKQMPTEPANEKAMSVLREFSDEGLKQDSESGSAFTKSGYLVKRNTGEKLVRGQGVRKQRTIARISRSLTASSSFAGK
ncbi:fatty acid-binding protein-like [Palaemon carinicauda]|uniref:fatty acid-binding protein-like n=1 Tax=Palaemon carinicauda TaxID=392227 RepID=UPI0035B61EBA